MEHWIPEAINYQINLRSLAAREPRNPIEAANEPDSTSSPLAYLTRNLIVLKQLGVNLLHLMPPFPMGQAGRKGIGSPYAVRDYRDIDPEFGDLTECKAFIRAAHQEGFQVILGMVPNHTARDHIWVREHPTFYVPGADGPAFDADWSDTAKLDYTRLEVRREMISTLDFWLSITGHDPDGKPTGVDGFRIDMPHLVNDRSFWDQALLELRERHPHRELLFLAECYSPQDREDLFQRGFNAAYDDALYKICQYAYGVDEQGQSLILEAPEAARPADFAEIYGERGLAGAVEHLLVTSTERLGSGETAPRLARYTDNHDEGRGIYRFGEGAVLAMNQLIFLLNNTIPFLYCGQEFGAVNRPSIHERIGLCDKSRRVRVGDTVRVDPGIEFEGNLFARGAKRRRGWYSLYQDLIALRLHTPELVHGRFYLLEAGEACPQSRRTVVAFERRWEDSLVRCAVNLGPEPRKLNHASLFRRQPLFGALVDGALAPFTSIVVRAS